MPTLGASAANVAAARRLRTRTTFPSPPSPMQKRRRPVVGPPAAPLRLSGQSVGDIMNAIDSIISKFDALGVVNGSPQQLSDCRRMLAASEFNALGARPRDRVPVGPTGVEPYRDRPEVLPVHGPPYLVVLMPVSD
jgi:hypothetical protein